MAVISKNEMQELATQRNGPCLSIYMPVHRAGTDTLQDPIRLKNLIRQGEEKLIATGMRSTMARNILAPAAALVEDPFFWEQSGSGLALFLSADYSRYYRLPINFAEEVIVSNHFLIHPLQPLITYDGLFYILALSQNQVKLFQCTRYSTDEVKLEDVPPSLEYALRFDQLQQELQFHTMTAPRPAIGAGGERMAMFYGTGAGDLDAKDRILRFFQQVDKGLHEKLRDERAPLVLASVEYLHPIYREANTYPHLVNEVIPGNPEETLPKELCARAWSILEPFFQQKRQDAAAQYQNLLGTGRTANDVRELAPAAYHGRIGTLFLAPGVRQWGRYDPDNDQVELREQPDPYDDDLSNFTALYTFLNGGAIYAVSPGEMPDGSTIAGILRY